MNQAQFKDPIHENAWQEVEMTFRSAGMVGPLPGFVDRWNQRLAMERMREERKQATVLVVTNIVIALGFLALVGLQIVPSMLAGHTLLTLWVNLVARLVVLLKMFSGVAETLLRTLPSIIPVSWWLTGLGVLGALVVVWAGMMRQHLTGEGA